MKRALFSCLLGFAFATEAACSKGRDTGIGPDASSLSDGGSTRIDASSTDSSAEDATDRQDSDVRDAIAEEAAPPMDKITNESVTAAGRTRTFVLVVPHSYVATTSYPIVMYFHGDGQTGANMQSIVHFEDVSNQNAIVVYPDGETNTWDLYGAIATNKDLAFVDAVIVMLTGRFNVAANRVYGAGSSSGAFFVNQVACRKPGVFRAISPNSGGAPNEPGGSLFWPNGYVKCVSNEAPTPAMVIHGALDPQVPLASGDFSATYWAYVNGCTTTRAASSPSPCVANTGCGANPVRWCAVPALAHDPWIAGLPAVWAFFDSFR